MKLLRRFAPLLLAVVLVFGSCLSVSAADTLADNIPTLPEGINDYAYNMYLYYDGVYWLITSSVPFYANENNMLCLNKNSATLISCYKLLGDGRGTHEFKQSTVSNGTFVFKSGEYLVTADYNIYYSDGETLFFPPTPPNPVRAVEILPEVIAPQMKIVATIAVSCLALLISLVMLRKKLPIFLHS